MPKPILTKLGMLRNGRGTTYTLLPIHCIAIPDAQTTVARNEQFPLSRLVSIPELQGVNKRKLAKKPKCCQICGSEEQELVPQVLLKYDLPKRQASIDSVKVHIDNSFHVVCLSFM